jgi:O-antigen ligase
LSVTRTQVAIAVALLATHTFATKTSAEDVLENPLVIDRVLRGALAATALIIIAPLLISRIRDHGNRRHPSLTAISLYVLVATTSVLYSAAEVVTAGKVFELIAGFAIVWTIALSRNAREEARSAIHFVILLETAIVVASFIGFFLLPGDFTFIKNRPGFLLRETMVSPFAHSNSLSASGALVAAYALAMFFNVELSSAKRRWITVMVIGTVTVALSSGRQGLVIWLVSVILVLWVHRRRLFLTLIGPASAILVALNWDSIWASVQRGQAAGSLATWSGRLTYWASAIEVWQDHPWTGYGFGAGGRFVALDALGLDVSSLHSGYFEALTGVGLLGLIPLLYAVFRTSWWAGRELLANRSIPAIAMVPLLLHTLVSLGFGAWLRADFLILAFLAVLADRDAGQRESGEAHAVPAGVP